MDAINAVIGPLRPTLQSIARSMPAPIQDTGVSMLGNKCYSSLVLNVDLSSANSGCLSLAFSKVLGLLIVGGSAVLKVPQIIKLVNNQSAEGLSFLSYLLETTAFVINLSYNIRNGNPFSTFGEQAFIAAQNVVITLLILVYSGQQPAAAAFVAGLSAVLYALLGPGELVSLEGMNYLLFASGFIGVASKLPQVYANYTQGHTGQLSAYAVINILFGGLARVFTTLKEVDDKIILGSYLAGTALNLVIFCQLIYYWNVPAPKPGKQADVKADGPAVSYSTSASGASKGNGSATRRRG